MFERNFLFFVNMTNIPHPSELDVLCNKNTMNQVFTAIIENLYDLRNRYPVYCKFKDNEEACRILQKKWMVSRNCV
jgi:hypothetical protein